MLNGHHHQPILLPGAGRPEENRDPLSCELLAMASRWLNVCTRGMTQDDARRVLRAEISRLDAIRRMMEDGL